MKINVGDYIIDPEKNVFIIIEKFSGIDFSGKNDRIYYYSIKSLKELNKVEIENIIYKMPISISAIPEKNIRKLGKIIPKEKFTKLAQILYL